MILRHKLLPYFLVISLLCLLGSTAFASEIQLAGIKLGRPSTAILQKFGNPTDIRVGASAETTTTTEMGMPGMPGTPVGMPGMPGMPGMAPPPPSPGMGMPGMPGMPGMSGLPGAQSTVQTVTQSAPEVTWIYKFSKNRTLEFVINSDGRVLQIAAYGSEWPGLKTSKGLGIGSTYKDVIAKYGFPEAHENRGLELIMKYPEKHRAVFTLIGKHVVGITIALMD